MISLMYAGNERVFDGIMISCLSVIKHTQEPVTVYLLTMDYSEKDPRFLPLTVSQCNFLEGLLQRGNVSSRVVRIDVGDLYRTHLAGNPNEENSYTPFALLRLLSDRISVLPDKVLYLDTDTVFAADPSLLFHYPLENDEFAVVRDHYGCHFFGINYFNSGVILMNLARLRQTGALAKAASMCKRKKIFLSDQTALNRAIKHKRLLPRRFNEQKNLHPDTVVRHFSMTIRWFPYFHTRNIKPWQIEQVHEVLHLHAFDDVLEEYRSCLAEFQSRSDTNNEQ